MINIIAISIAAIVVIVLMLQIVMWVQKKLYKTVLYTIKKGKHYCSNLLPFIIGYNIDKLSYKVTFTESCLYDESELEFSGVNKLPGITRLLVHNNSYRWGWRSIKDENKIELYAYTYDKGVRSIVPIIKVDINVELKLDIYIGIDRVSYALNDYLLYSTSELETIDDSPFSYINRVYFGGKSTAPNTMDIKIEYEYGN